VGSRKCLPGDALTPMRHADAPATPWHAGAQKNGEKKLRRCAAGRGPRARAATRLCTAAQLSWRAHRLARRTLRLSCGR
jgi:hypothetical protein